jgi:hypothetical protein
MPLPTSPELLLAIRRKIRALAGKIADSDRDESVPSGMTESQHLMHLAEVALEDADTPEVRAAARKFLKPEDF